MLRWYSVCCTVWYCWWGWLTDQPTGLSGCDEQVSHTRQYHYQMWTCGGRYQCLLTGMWIFWLYRIPSLCKHPDLTQQHSLWLWMMVWLISAEMRANVCVIFVIVCPMQCMALDRYKINWVYVCLSVCPKDLSSFDSDRSFCPIFLEFQMWVTHLTTKSKFDGQ